ncbi:MAG: hypothetical protein LBT38_00055 [Deltaproteobacteria bacterium]|nr:hypothetical protein [Deltaproteobacteria bacterium]
MVKLILVSLGQVNEDIKKFCRKTVLFAKSLVAPVKKTEFALVVASTYTHIKDELYGEDLMNQLADLKSGGKISKVKNALPEKDAEIARIEKSTAETYAEIARIENAAAEKAKLIKRVFKMKLDNLDLPTISLYSGLSVEEVEEILN